jgi:hypothetical protein
MQQISNDGSAAPSGRMLKTLINVFEYLIDGKK